MKLRQMLDLLAVGSDYDELSYPELIDIRNSIEAFESVALMPTTLYGNDHALQIGDRERVRVETVVYTYPRPGFAAISATQYPLAYGSNQNRFFICHFTTPVEFLLSLGCPCPHRR